MRKISLILLSIGALLAVSLYWQGPASADPGRDAGAGQGIAGVWLGWFEWEGYDPPIEPPTAVILTIDPQARTITATSSAALGRGDPNTFSLRSAFRMTYERTGQNEVATRHLMFMHTPDGALLFIIRTTGELTFSREGDSHDFDRLDGVLEAELFTPDQLLGVELRGPITPNTEEPGAFGVWPGGVIHAKRLEVPDDDD